MMLIKDGKKIVDAGRLSRLNGAQAPMFYSTVFSELPVPGLVIDFHAGGKIIDANRAAVDALKTTPSKIIGAFFPDLFDVDFKLDVSDVAQLFPVGSEHIYNYEQSNPKPSIEISGISQFDMNGKTLVTLLFRRKKLSDSVQADLQERMFLDIESGLPNGLAAKRKLEMFGQTNSWASRVYAVAIFSVENKQEIKELSKGYFAALIRKLGLRLKLWDDQGVFVSRHQKDGFLVILEGIKDYKEIFENIFADLLEPVVMDKNNICFFPVNAGVYAWSVWESQAANDMLAKVREAHYQSLSIGHNRLRFYRERQNLNDWQEVEGLRITDAFRRGNFCFHFQPLSQFSSDAPCIVEALLRWNDPGRGVKEPLEFLVKLKSLPIYDDISLWVVDLALTTLERWRKAGHHVKLCINIEATQLAKSEFVDRMLSVLSRFSSRASKSLSIDIVNSSMLGNYVALVSALRTLSVYGIEFSVDDFVFDNAQLLEIEPVPVRSLKIARHCLKGLEHSLTDMRLVREVVCLAARHDVTVYAKGVERAAQYNVLKALGCGGVQGYLQSTPLVEADFLSYLESFYQPENPVEGSESLINLSEIFSDARCTLQDALFAYLATCDAQSIPATVLQSLLSALCGVVASNRLVEWELGKVKKVEQTTRHLLKLVSESGAGAGALTGEDMKQRSVLTSEILVSLSELIVAIDGIVR
jgi:EAL domain-containing protein (putative c-di-GMP-specific phosphodiesterase class I)/GGDEF domain-containing protein